MNKKRISQFVLFALVVNGLTSNLALSQGIQTLPTVPVHGSWSPWSPGGGGGGIGGGAGDTAPSEYISNPGNDSSVKDASEGTGCGGSDPAHANPIVLSTGNKIEVETDFTSEGEMPLSLVRSYNYYLSFAGIFGW